MRSLYFFLILVIPAYIGAASYRSLARVERIDPITHTAEVTSAQKLSPDSEYRILSETGETLGYARGIKPRTGDTYTFTFESKRRNLSAGRRIVLAVTETQFSALADRPRMQKEPAIRFELRDKEPMQYIPEGTFILGSQNPRALDFIPAVREGKAGNRADTAGFFIDKHEVTVGQYIRYLEETRVKIPAELSAQNINLPLTHMTYREAEAYCAWTSKRLPSELEWEKAARGVQIITQGDEAYTEAQSFPVPEDRANELCVSADKATGPVAVERLKDVNGFGLIGMCGNAAEWTSSWLMPYRGNTNHDERFGKRYKVIRGGSYELDLENAKSYARMAGGIPSLTKDRRAGFRCARSE